MLAQSTEYNGTDSFGQHVFSSNLDHARTCGVCECEEVAEIEIMGEDHETMLSGPLQDISIRSPRIADLCPVLCQEPSSPRHRYLKLLHTPGGVG